MNRDRNDRPFLRHLNNPTATKVVYGIGTFVIFCYIFKDVVHRKRMNYILMPPINMGNHWKLNGKKCNVFL